MTTTYATWGEFNERADQLREELTGWTERAHGDLLARARKQFGPVRYHRAGGTLDIWVPGEGDEYVAVVRGQALSHGRTGMHPRRVAAYREVSWPVLFVSAQGSTLWWGWLEALPDPARISANPASPRVGWLANREMTKCDTAAFAFPAAVPSEPEGRLFA